MKTLRLIVFLVVLGLGVSTVQALPMPDYKSRSFDNGRPIFCSGGALDIFHYGVTDKVGNYYFREAQRHGKVIAVLRHLRDSGRLIDVWLYNHTTKSLDVYYTREQAMEKYPSGPCELLESAS